VSDPEIEAMTSIATALADLEEDAQERVLRWAAARFGVSVAVDGHSNGGAPLGTVVGGDGGDRGADVESEAITGEPATYEHFAELFAAASPKSNEDKALVAAYWVQVHEQQAQWQSRRVNNALKDMGYAIPNITDALTSNIRKKPQRVIQLKKSGASRQAIKTYKMTDAGIRYVRDMIGQRST
jgi:hypothetical protein